MTTPTPTPEHRNTPEQAYAAWYRRTGNEEDSARLFIAAVHACIDSRAACQPEQGTAIQKCPEPGCTLPENHHDNDHRDYDGRCWPASPPAPSDAPGDTVAIDRKVAERWLAEDTQGFRSKAEFEATVAFQDALRTPQPAAQPERDRLVQELVKAGNRLHAAFAGATDVSEQRAGWLSAVRALSALSPPNPPASEGKPLLLEVPEENDPPLGYPYGPGTKPSRLAEGKPEAREEAMQRLDEADENWVKQCKCNCEACQRLEHALWDVLAQHATSRVRAPEGNQRPECFCCGTPLCYADGKWNCLNVQCSPPRTPEGRPAGGEKSARWVPPCPKCLTTRAVIAVPGVDRWVCRVSDGGCGEQWSPSATPAPPAPRGCGSALTAWQNAAIAGYQLSTYAASSREDNTPEFVEGVYSRVRETQRLYDEAMRYGTPPAPTEGEGPTDKVWIDSFHDAQAKRFSAPPPPAEKPGEGKTDWPYYSEPLPNHIGSKCVKDWRDGSIQWGLVTPQEADMLVWAMNEAHARTALAAATPPQHDFAREPINVTGGIPSDEFDEDHPAASPPPSGCVSVSGRGVELIAAERERQVSAEGWTPDHDDAPRRGRTGPRCRVLRD